VLSAVGAAGKFGGIVYGRARLLLVCGAGGPAVIGFAAKAVPFGAAAIVLIADAVALLWWGLS